MGKHIEISVTGSEDAGKCITAADVAQFMRGYVDPDLERITEQSYKVVRDYGGGLVELETSPLLDEIGFAVVPLAASAGILPGRCFVFNRQGSCLDNMTLRRYSQDEDNALLIVADRDDVRGPGVALKPVKLSVHGTFCEAWAIRETETGAYVSLQDLRYGLRFVARLEQFSEGLLATVPDELEGGQRFADERRIQGTARPRFQIDPNSKLANKIVELRSGETTFLGVGKSADTVVCIEYKGEGISLERPIDRFDREVHNAAVTLWKAGNEAFTVNQVWHTMNYTKSDPSPAQAARIEASIDKQRFTSVWVDFTQEAHGRELELDGDPVESYRINAPMLNAEKHAIRTANGAEAEGYIVVSPPILYRHAAPLGQLIQYPTRLLDTSSAGQNTRENILIKKYLLRRIGMAKGKSKMSPRIKYSSVYREAELEEPDKKQRMRVRNYVKACLELWQDDGYIKGFSEYKEGRLFSGVDIVI